MSKKTSYKNRKNHKKVVGKGLKSIRPSKSTKTRNKYDKRKRASIISKELEDLLFGPIPDPVPKRKIIEGTL